MQELLPIYDARKSFYGKARVTVDGFDGFGGWIKAPGEKYLYSYNTVVCYIDAENTVHLLPAWNYSATTLRHVKEFLKQNGRKAENAAQIRKDYFNN